MRKIVIIILILWIGLAIGVALLTHKKPEHHPSTTHHVVLATPPTVEKGSSGNQQSINIQDTDALSNYLLAEQFAAVKQALGQYIQSNIGASILTATIVSGSTVLNNDGSINFTVQITKPSTAFNVLIQRSNPEEIIFSVVGTNYQNTLYPYATGGNTE